MGETVSHTERERERKRERGGVSFRYYSDIYIISTIDLRHMIGLLFYIIWVASKVH